MALMWEGPPRTNKHLHRPSDNRTYRKLAERDARHQERARQAIILALVAIVMVCMVWVGTGAVWPIFPGLLAALWIGRLIAEWVR